MPSIYASDSLQLVYEARRAAGVSRKASQMVTSWHRTDKIFDKRLGTRTANYLKSLRSPMLILLSCISLGRSSSCDWQLLKTTSAVQAFMEPFQLSRKTFLVLSTNKKCSPEFAELRDVTSRCTTIEILFPSVGPFISENIYEAPDAGNEQLHVVIKSWGSSNRPRMFSCVGL